MHGNYGTVVTATADADCLLAVQMLPKQIHRKLHCLK